MPAKCDGAVRAHEHQSPPERADVVGEPGMPTSLRATENASGSPCRCRRPHGGTGCLWIVGYRRSEGMVLHQRSDLTEDLLVAELTTVSQSPDISLWGPGANLPECPVEDSNGDAHDHQRQIRRRPAAGGAARGGQEVRSGHALRGRFRGSSLAKWWPCWDNAPGKPTAVQLLLGLLRLGRRVRLSVRTRAARRPGAGRRMLQVPKCRKPSSARTRQSHLQLLPQSPPRGGGDGGRWAAGPGEQAVGKPPAASGSGCSSPSPLSATPSCCFSTAHRWIDVEAGAPSWSVIEGQAAEGRSVLLYHSLPGGGGRSGGSHRPHQQRPHRGRGTPAEIKGTAWRAEIRCRTA